MTTMLLFTVIFSPRFSVLAAEFGIEYALDAAAVAYVTQQCGCVNVTLN